MLFLNVVLTTLLIVVLARSFRLDKENLELHKKLFNSLDENRILRNEIIRVKLRQYEADHRESQ